MNFKDLFHRSLNREVAYFRLHISSPDQKFDSAINKSIENYDSHIENLNLEKEQKGGYLKELCERIVSYHLHNQVIVRNFKVEYGGSVTITFTLAWTVGISAFVLVSRYDNFRNSLDRIKEDISRLLSHIARRQWSGNEPLYSDTFWIPSKLLLGIEAKLFRRFETYNDFTTFFIWYLVITNILLTSAVITLVYKAVKQTYFK
jgi:hypothetical protein